MKSNIPPGAPQAAATARTGNHAGATVRKARLAAGLTLADLGRRCGYSASQISRYERGVQPLTDINLLRRLAKTLAIHPQAFGLSPHESGSAERHAPIELKDRPGGAADSRVGRAFLSEDGEDPVRRRELLAVAAGLAGAGALSQQAIECARVCDPADPADGIQDLLYSGGTAQPVPLSNLRAATITARTDFQAARYDRLAVILPRLIAVAATTRDCAKGGDHAAASALLADAYIAAANLMIKLNDDPLAWTMGDRALQAAQVGDDPLTVADARRALATVMRHTGRRARAHALLISAARDIEPAGRASADQLSMYGALLETAAYTAAVDGRRAEATSLISEAREAAGRLGTDANHRFIAFGPSNVVLHQISIAQVLGDSGTAIEHAKTLRPAAIPTAERRGRYWVDVARAYHQWGRSEPCFRALLAAEHAAPAEVRYRPPVHRITEDLLRADHRHALAGLPGFARRIGMPAV
ncbi:MAG TPA: helix-turn-helix transcriptional regulator [Streptosporangiaceae bacterium]|jgi:transcriptional regulator with XRE-family HTH domain